jgi:hypothetical protein
LHLKLYSHNNNNNNNNNTVWRNLHYICNKHWTYTQRDVGKYKKGFENKRSSNDSKYTPFHSCQYTDQVSPLIRESNDFRTCNATQIRQSKRRCCLLRVLNLWWHRPTNYYRYKVLTKVLFIQNPTPVNISKNISIVKPTRSTFCIQIVVRVAPPENGQVVLEICTSR